MSPNRVIMPEQQPDVRAKNFDEVALGYDLHAARSEAARCLGCKHRPCVDGCPVGVDIPTFITQLADGDPAAAFETISRSNALPAICGRVCPQENQCEARCVRGIKHEPVAIGRLERFAADWARENLDQPTAAHPQGGKKVAVIGAGPAGLTCAGELASHGYAVTIFEAFHLAGGVLVYGIPEFRLPKAIVRHEIAALEKRGVTMVTNFVVGRTMTVDQLFDDGFKAVFIGSGAGLPRFMGIPGEGLNGVYSANECLTRVNLMKAYLPNADTPLPAIRRVAVIGGGNVAMDAARCALRTGAEEVYIIYRRGREEMPARAEEVHHAEQEGVIFKLLCNPTEVLPDEHGGVRGIRCAQMTLGQPDASGRRSPVDTGQTFELEVDTVVMALGTSPNPLLAATTDGIRSNARGCLEVDDNLQTTRAGVFAGGDAVTGAATVILAMGAGKIAATSIDAYLKSVE